MCQLPSTKPDRLAETESFELARRLWGNSAPRPAVRFAGAKANDSFATPLADVQADCMLPLKPINCYALQPPSMLYVAPVTKPASGDVK